MKSQYCTCQSWLARESRRTRKDSQYHNISHSTTETKEEKVMSFRILAVSVQGVVKLQNKESFEILYGRSLIATGTGEFEMTLFSYLYQVSPIPLPCLRSTLFLSHNRSMISSWKIQCMDISWTHSLKFWDILLDELTVCIELLWL